MSGTTCSVENKTNGRCAKRSSTTSVRGGQRPWVSARSFQGNNLWHKDGCYISSSNSSRLFGGNGRISSLLARTLIAAVAENPKKITPLTQTKATQIENPREKERDVGLDAPHRSTESRPVGNQARQQTLGSEDGDQEQR